MHYLLYIQPEDAWDFHSKNRFRLEEELVEIASNATTRTSVYITDEDGFPYLYVYRDDKKVYQAKCLTYASTEYNLGTVYRKYILPAADCVDEKSVADAYQEDMPDNGPCETIHGVDDDPDMPCSELDAMSSAEFQDMVDEREDEIYAAVQDLIEVLTEDTTGAMDFDNKDVPSADDIVDHIVEYLAIKCGLRIRRPMLVLDDESGLNVRTEYPYEEYDFSDDELHG